MGREKEVNKMLEYGASKKEETEEKREVVSIRIVGRHGGKYSVQTGLEFAMIHKTAGFVYDEETVYFCPPSSREIKKRIWEKIKSKRCIDRLRRNCVYKLYERN